MFLIITRDTMFFTAMKNILSKGNVVHTGGRFDQDLVSRRIMDAGTGDAVQLLFVVRDAGTKAAHGEARAYESVGRIRRLRRIRQAAHTAGGDAERTGRNPQTGKEIKIAAANVPALISRCCCARSPCSA